jgi:antirestriction protein ArdC
MPVRPWRNLSKKSARLFYAPISGITPQTRDDHAAYIASWLKVLKDDDRAIFTAASHAQKAADFLHGLQPNADTAPAEDLQEAA